MTLKEPEFTEIQEKAKMKEEIRDFELEIERFQYGIDVISMYPMVLKSFILMNEASLKTSKKYSTWRCSRLFS